MTLRGGPARWLALGLAASSAGLLYVGLAWLDVVPGGWRLRTLIWTPQELADQKRAEHRAERLAQFATEDVPAGGVLFIGSSTIEFFDLERAFPGAPTVDRGIGDEDLDGLAARLFETLDATRPASVVLYAASVDFRRHRTPAPVLAERVGALLDRLLADEPALELTLIGILPERTMPAEMAARLDRTNAALEALAAARPRVAFVSTARPPLVDPTDGTLRAAVAADQLHLNSSGYAALADWLCEDVPALGRRLRP